MGLIPLLLAAGINWLAPKLKNTTPEQNYGSIPSIADPNIWGAGTMASRQARGASGLPDGNKWGAASQFMASMPKLIAK
jgi:hypothetical protein